MSEMKPCEEKALRVAWAAVHHGQRMMPTKGTTEQLVATGRALDELALAEEFDMERAIKMYRYDPCFHSIVDLILATYNRPDIQRETSEACAEIVRVYGEIQTSPEAKAACLEISALLKELGKAKTAEELLANLAKGGE